MTLRERVPHLPASPSVITFQFHSLVVSLSDIKGFFPVNNQYEILLGEDIPL